MTPRTIATTVVFLVAVVALSVSSVCAGGKIKGAYKTSGTWSWRWDEYSAKGKHAGSFTLEGSDIDGLTRYYAGCTASFHMKVLKTVEPGTDRRLRMDIDYGEMHEVCVGAESDHEITNGNFVFKRNNKGQWVYNGAARSVVIHGDRVGGVLVQKYKGRHN